MSIKRNCGTCKHGREALLPTRYGWNFFIFCELSGDAIPLLSWRKDCPYWEVKEIRLGCKYQHKKEGDPWIYCSYFKDENVICGWLGIEEMCDIYRDKGSEIKNDTDTRRGGFRNL